MLPRDVSALIDTVSSYRGHLCFIFNNFSMMQHEENTAAVFHTRLQGIPFLGDSLHSGLTGFREMTIPLGSFLSTFAPSLAMDFPKLTCAQSYIPSSRLEVT